MSLMWNSKISVSFFGEPHDSVIGINIDNIPPDEYINADEIFSFMKRLCPKSMNMKKKISSPRIISGIRNDYTTGTPLCAIIQNGEIRTEGKKKSSPPNVRTGHADYTGALRYKGFSDVIIDESYPEHFILPLCFAGAVAAQILERRGIYTGAHIAKIHNVKDNPFDPVNITRDGILGIRCKDFPVINDRRGWLMLEDIAKARNFGESLGGVVECATVNVPAGVGSPIFNGIRNNIAQLVFGIPGVNGVEFGSGFSASSRTGSSCDDSFYTDSKGYSVTRTNNHGGIIGGISSGMPITFRVSVSPVRKDGESFSETCFVPSAVLCVESAVNIAILSNMTDYPNFCLR